jgi:hypothetical protein
MDWALTINRNRDLLTQIAASLFAVPGLDPRSGITDGGSQATLPRHYYRAALIVLQPAEAAVRRLVIIAARGLAVKLRPARAFPSGHPLRIGATRNPAFCHIDLLKRFLRRDKACRSKRGGISKVRTQDEFLLCHFRKFRISPRHRRLQYFQRALLRQLHRIAAGSRVDNRHVADQRLALLVGVKSFDETAQRMRHFQLFA